jgi:hypothetical protein
MGWWELRAHVLLRNARLLWFGRGVSRPRRPIVGLTKSTFGCFCDGSKDFLSYHGYFRTFTQLITQGMLNSVYIALMRFVPPLVTHGKEISGPLFRCLVWSKAHSANMGHGSFFWLDTILKYFIDRRVDNFIGIGTTLHKLTDTKETSQSSFVSYHLPQTNIRLFSLQLYHHMHGGYSEVHIDCIKITLITSEIQIQFMREKEFLPNVFEYVSPTWK